MSSSGTKDRVRSVIRKTFGISEATPGELRMGAVPGWDSMGHMDLVVALEDEFGTSFPTHVIAGLVDEDRIVAALGTGA